MAVVVVVVVVVVDGGVLRMLLELLVLETLALPLPSAMGGWMRVFSDTVDPSARKEVAPATDLRD